MTTELNAPVPGDSAELRDSLISYARHLADSTRPETERLSLRDLNDDHKNEIITVHVLDAPEGSRDFSGRLVDFAKEYLNPEWSHITGKITLIFEGNWSATVNLYDEFTYTL